jgi:hypothetical protein
MPIDLPKLLLTRPEAVEVQYLTANENLLIAKGPPVWKGPLGIGGAGVELNFKPYRVFVITVDEYPIAPIKAMTLPKYWWRYKSAMYSLPGTYSYEFSPRGDKKTIISLNRRDDIGDFEYESKVSKILDAPLHDIDAAECKVLKFESTEYQTLRTEEINGRRVIWGEGVDSDHQPFIFLFYLSQPEPYGCAGIYFTATPKKYKLYVKAVKASLKTIEWETTARKSRSN